MLADNARQLDLPKRPFQRRRDPPCAHHYVVVAHDADPEIRAQTCTTLQNSAN
jgi:hypothetical protein